MSRADVQSRTCGEVTSGTRVHSLDGEISGDCVSADISESGLQIRCGAAFPAGSVVRFALGSLLLTGEVRQCRPVDGGMYDTALRVLSAQSVESAINFEYVSQFAPLAPGERL